MQSELKQKVKRSNRVLDKRKGVKRMHPFDALKRIMNPSRVLLPRESIPESMGEFLSISSKMNHFIPTVEQKDFFWNQKDKLSHKYIHAVDTRYVEVSVKALSIFYGNAICNPWRIKKYNAVNFNRMSGAEHIEFDRWVDIVDVCSAGLWSIEFMDPKGCYIHSYFDLIGMDDPLEIMKQNQLICANMSHIIGNNAKYYRGEKNKTPTEEEYYAKHGYEV